MVKCILRDQVNPGSVGFGSSQRIYLRGWCICVCDMSCWSVAYVPALGSTWRSYLFWTKENDFSVLCPFCSAVNTVYRSPVSMFPWRWVLHLMILCVVHSFFSSFFSAVYTRLFICDLNVWFILLSCFTYRVETLATLQSMWARKRCKGKPLQQFALRPRCNHHMDFYHLDKYTAATFIFASPQWNLCTCWWIDVHIRSSYCSLYNSYPHFYLRH